MTDIQILEKAIEEIETKQFGTTQQLLEIHEVDYVDNKPRALRIDREKKDGTAIVYFAVKDEKFYVAVYLDTDPEISVRGVGTENYNSVYLKVSSEILSLSELTGLTKLQKTNGWNKGDHRPNGKSLYNFSALFFEPNPEPDEFEEKLQKLLDFLEEDKVGVINLGCMANVQIQVVSIFHNGNNMLGGHHLDKNILKRMSDLNLEIDLDLYVAGKSFKD